MFGDFLMPKVNNVRKAREVYNELYETNHFDKMEFVLQEWNKLYLPTVQKIIQDKDIDAFFDLFKSHDMPPKGEAVDVADAAFDLFVSMISTPQQAMSYYPQCENDNNHYQKLVKRWNELSFLEIENASNISEIKNAIENSTCNSDLFDKGMMKWMGFCHTVDEVEELVCYKCYSIYSSVGKALLKKKVSILFTETPKVTDIETIKSYYSIAPAGSAVKIYIFEKWLELCTAPEQANEAYADAPNDAIVWRLKAYKRAKQLADSSQ